ncbi:hypothetical protein FOA52_001987 [Chlamydomonas sp. UWO 241]|nr:hypothetical protein FOA52_001987 [Chlamydomonas sp. UWO 241]
MEAPSMQQQNAVALLSPGCVELGLPKALATELWHLLTVRAHHSDAGPSSTVDELWHCAADLPRAKILRRLRSLNLLLAAGHAPREELWREPNVKLTKLPMLSELTSEPTGCFVYAAFEALRRTPHQDIVRFVSQNCCAPGQSLGRGGEQAKAGELGKRAAPEGQVVHEQRKQVQARITLPQSCQPENADKLAASYASSGTLVAA